MFYKKIVAVPILALTALLLLPIPGFAATGTSSPDQANHTFTILSAHSKNATGKVSPKAVVAACGVALSAGKNNPTMLEGSELVNCTEPLVIIIDGYAEYCNAGAFGVCWGGWNNNRARAYSQCSEYTNQLFCGTWYKSVGTNQIWRIRSYTCIEFTTGTECTTETQTVTF